MSRCCGCAKGKPSRSKRGMRARGSSRRRWIRRFRQIARGLIARRRWPIRLPGRFILKARNGAMCWWPALRRWRWQIIRGSRWGRSAVRWVNPRVGRNYRANIPPRFFRTHRAPVAPCRMAHCNSAILSPGRLRRSLARSARPRIVKCVRVSMARAHGVAT